MVVGGTWCQGAMALPERTAFLVLILMGDWCGSVRGADIIHNDNRDATWFSDRSEGQSFCTHLLHQRQKWEKDWCAP